MTDQQALLILCAEQISKLLLAAIPNAPDRATERDLRGKRCQLLLALDSARHEIHAEGDAACKTR